MPTDEMAQISQDPLLHVRSVVQFDGAFFVCAMGRLSVQPI